MTEEAQESMISTQERPTFLTVLCVLTFIGSGFGILMGIAKLISSPGLGFVSGAGLGLMIALILGLLSSAFCLLGAFKVWDLSKKGFLIYVIGAALAIIAAIIDITSLGGGTKSGLLPGTIPDTMNQLTSWSRFGAKVFIDVLFVVLYSLNRKSLVN